MDIEYLKNFSSWNVYNWSGLFALVVGFLLFCYFSFYKADLKNKNEIYPEITLQVLNVNCIKLNMGLIKSPRAPGRNVIVKYKYSGFKKSQQTSVFGGESQVKFDVVYSNILNKIGEVNTEFGRFDEIVIEMMVAGEEFTAKNYKYLVTEDNHKIILKKIY